MPAQELLVRSFAAFSWQLWSLSLGFMVVTKAAHLTDVSEILGGGDAHHLATTLGDPRSHGALLQASRSLPGLGTLAQLHTTASQIKAGLLDGTLTNWGRDVPPALWGHASVVFVAVVNSAERRVERIAHQGRLVRIRTTAKVHTDPDPAPVMTQEDWRRLPLGVRRAVTRRSVEQRYGLFPFSMCEILTSWGEDVHPAVHHNPSVVDEVLHAMESVAEGKQNCPGRGFFTDEDWRRLPVAIRGDAGLVRHAIALGFVRDFEEDVAETLWGDYLGPTSAFTVEDWCSFTDEVFSVNLAIRHGFLTQWNRDVPERLRKSRLIIGTALETRTMAFAEEDWRCLQTYVDEEVLAKARAARDDSAR
eukprot:g9838.t1